MCCSSWGCKELDTTERLNSTELTLVAQMVKHLPAMRETQVQFLGWEDPGEGNGNPLQHSCLENPMDGGA